MDFHLLLSLLFSWGRIFFNPGISSIQIKQNGKFKTLEELGVIVASHRAADKKIVHCHGVFDLLHIGHIRYFVQARQMGDVLCVTVTPDRFVDKGPHRPAFTETLRAEAIASLDCVDYVAINQWPTAEWTLRQLRPHVYVKGADHLLSTPVGLGCATNVWVRCIIRSRRKVERALLGAF